MSQQKEQQIQMAPPLYEAPENRIQTETLDVLAQADNYNQWILETFRPYVGERVLEVGCGTGNFSSLLLGLERVRHLGVVDIVPAYIETLRNRLEIPQNKTLDARCQNIFRDSAGLGRYDTIILINVLEHIRNDREAVATLRRLLNPGGRLIILVPAMRFLYSRYDRSIRHFRRYEKTRLAMILDEQGVKTEFLRYFNFVGMFGWWMKFCLMRQTEMHAGSVAFFDKISPLLRSAESLVSLPAGLSLIAVARLGQDTDL